MSSTRRIMWWGFFLCGWWALFCGHHDQAVSLFVGSAVLGELPKNIRE